MRKWLLLTPMARLGDLALLLLRIVTGAFLVLVLLVVAANARVWWQLLAGRRAEELREEAYVPLARASVVK